MVGLKSVESSEELLRTGLEIAHVRDAELLVVNADLLLITRSQHGGPFHHLGSVARAVLREAHCPVQILPPGPD